MSQMTPFGRKIYPCWCVFVVLRGKCIHESVCVDDVFKESCSSEGEVAGVVIAQGSSAWAPGAGSERRIICIRTFLVACGLASSHWCPFSNKIALSDIVALFFNNRFDGKIRLSQETREYYKPDLKITDPICCFKLSGGLQIGFILERRGTI